MYWKREDGEGGPAPSPPQGAGHLVYLALSPDQAFYKIGVGTLSRLRHWEGLRWRVIEYVATGADRRIAFIIEDLVKTRLGGTITPEEWPFSHSGRTEAWPQEWGPVHLVYARGEELWNIVPAEAYAAARARRRATT